MMHRSKRTCNLTVATEAEIGGVSGRSGHDRRGRRLPTWPVRGVLLRPAGQVPQGRRDALSSRSYWLRRHSENGKHDLRRERTCIKIVERIWRAMGIMHRHLVDHHIGDQDRRARLYITAIVMSMTKLSSLTAGVPRNCKMITKKPWPASPRRRFEALGAVRVKAPWPSRST